LIGANGRGKSTLLRILVGTEPITGERTIGYNVIPAFYAQHQLEALHVDNEILEELKQAGSGKTEQELRGILGCFLFSDEDVFKKIKVLSGGEKSRVALAKTLISEANFLLLDEPTNHLDFISENILIQALQQYKGSFVVVSHNRHFVSQIANKIWYIEDKQIKEYPGTYEEYEYWHKQRTDNTEAPPPPPKAKPAKQAEAPSAAQEERKRLEQELKKVESSIEKLDDEKSQLETALATPEVFNDYEKVRTKKEEIDAKSRQLEALTARWDEIISALGAQ
ncbi:MAG: ABC-F family ATP-binding cassette domain-containing protein, partial [Bacteroidia bacterium]|nr:ABC-F family ATP-binding cassette domain-containing protein [Bacteroidia bacterium]